MKSRSEGSAHWRSSKTSRIGSRSAIRSKNSRHAPNRSSGSLDPRALGALGWRGAGGEAPFAGEAPGPRAEEGRPRAGRRARPAAPGAPREGPPQGERFGLALELVGAAVLVGDGGFGGPAGPFAHEDLARLRGGLDPGRRVDQVAGHHALPLGADRDRGLTGEDAGPGSESR